MNDMNSEQIMKSLKIMGVCRLYVEIINMKTFLANEDSCWELQVRLSSAYMFQFNSHKTLSCSFYYLSTYCREEEIESWRD